MTDKLSVKSDLILYQTEDGKSRIEVRLEEEAVRMTLAAMADCIREPSRISVCT